jgi:hypothetical protein
MSPSQTKATLSPWMSGMRMKGSAFACVKRRKAAIISRRIYLGAEGMNGAQERTRTFTPLRGLAPEASASTNFTTWASGEVDLYPICGFKIQYVPPRPPAPQI